jgi:hypothetical protein
MLDIHQPMHWNPFLDSGVKDTQAKEKTATEKEYTSDKNEHHIPTKKRSDVFKDDWKYET